MTAPDDPFAVPTGGQTPGYGTTPPAYGAPPQAPVGNLATWGTRAAAALLDGLIVGAIIVVTVILGAILGSASSALGVLVFVVGYLGAFGFFIWQLVVQGQTGQTIGKGVMNIELVKEADGAYLGAGLSVGRYFVHFIDSFACYIGYLWPLWDAKRQTFADKILGTVVIKV